MGQRCTFEKTVEMVSRQAVRGIAHRDIEDARQEAALHAIAWAAQLDPARSDGERYVYLRRAARSGVLNFLDRQRRAARSAAPLFALEDDDEGGGDPIADRCIVDDRRSTRRNEDIAAAIRATWAESTPRQRAIIANLARGLNMIEIGAALSISPQRVSELVRRIREALEIHLAGAADWRRARRPTRRAAAN